MGKIYKLTFDQLPESYKQNITYILDGNLNYTSTANSISFTNEYCFVEVICNLGPVVLVRNLSFNVHTSNNVYKDFIIPVDLLVEEVIDNLTSEYTKVLEEVLPGRWLLKDSCIHIHYPELKLTNNLEQTHTIYDLIVRLTLLDSRRGLLDMHLAGARTTLTSREIESSYIHSHLPSIYEDEDSDEYVKMMNFDYFCLGGSSPFYQLMLKNSSRVLDNEEFRYFLSQLEQYLSWESIEGSPYMYFNTIGENGRDSRHITPSHTLRQVFSTLLIEFLKELETCTSLFTTVGKTPVFDPSMDPEKYLEVELRVIANNFSLLESEGILKTWDPSRNYYVSVFSNPTDTPEFPELDSTVATVAAAFNLSPRIIEDSVPVDTNNHIKRLPTDLLDLLTLNINKFLLQSILKNNAKGISIKEESSSSVDQGSVITDTVSAQSV